MPEMIVEFSRHGKTYQCTRATLPDEAPPLRITVAFKPSGLHPAFNLELEWVSTDARRMIEQYRPVEPDRQPVDYAGLMEGR
jgi:hypothetical protein